MSYLPDSLLQFIGAGAHLRVSSSSCLPDTLIQLATAAAQRGVSLTITGSALLPENVFKVIAAGKGHVTLDTAGP